MIHLCPCVAPHAKHLAIETPISTRHAESARLKLMLIVPLLTLMLYACAASASSREKTDIVYMRNGDKITGEIQSLEKGQLNVKPDYASSAIAIDWEK